MKILMVCLGNICRSPLAEGILQSKLPESFTVDSAGTISMHEGENPDKRAIKVAKNHGIDISKQCSRPFSQTDFDQYDLIYCMDLKNLEDVLSFAKTEPHKKKIKLLLEEAGNHENAEVEDPYWGGEKDFENCFQVLDKACDIVAAKILKA